MIAGDLALACALDAVVGDPRWLPHPVRLMGQMIRWYDYRVRLACRSKASLRRAGMGLALGLPALAYAAGWLILGLAGNVQEWAGRGLGIYLAFTVLAWRDLAGHASVVLGALNMGSLTQARQAVSLIVGRDTESLSEEEVVRATVETIAESTSDGVIAPLFYLALGGAPLALAYKAISTLDSMVGHPDERYLDLGWASAKLDDLANWIPARLSAGLMVIAAGLTMRSAHSALESWRILRRDGHKHLSPNSGKPEAAMAGALGVQLGGLNTYEGAPIERPRLGDACEPLVPSHIRLALRVMTAAYLLAIACAMGFSWL